MGAYFAAGWDHVLKSGNLDTDDLRILLIHAADLAAAEAVEGATNATPIVVTQTGHGRSNGDLVLIVGVGGNANANGFFEIAGVTTDTFQLTDPHTGANIAGSGAYTSGGYIIPMDSAAFADLADVDAGAIEETSDTLANTTVVDGLFDADDETFTAAAGDDVDFAILYYHTGTAGTSTLIMALTSDDFPLALNGSDVEMAFTGGIAQHR